jgi:hypothetical protein
LLEEKNGRKYISEREGYPYVSHMQNIICQRISTTSHPAQFTQLLCQLTLAAFEFEPLIYKVLRGLQLKERSNNKTVNV